MCDTSTLDLSDLDELIRRSIQLQVENKENKPKIDIIQQLKCKKAKSLNLTAPRVLASGFFSR